MRRRRFVVPLSIVAFLVLTLVGTYFVRKRILEKHMGAAMDVYDDVAVLRLAKAFPCPVDARGGLGWTPLHWAARRGWKEMVGHLLARGAGVEPRAE